MTRIHFGSEAEYIQINLPLSFSTDGWAQASVEISVNGFRGSIRPWVEVADFEVFAQQLRLLYESLQGQADFSPIERQFTLRLAGKSAGHVKLTGEAWSRATYENKLEYAIELDQSFLSAPLHEMEALLASFDKRAV
ncbi:hypothetical protein [Pelomonas sp. KK5]|uniref:WapI family immunity protein n=1 Tax=Pelomonas sp. KK5 TaxID=1855730 RepID=UPI00097CAC1A|nr:hypothetical protein [Pelomonas sp. KK5]